MRCSGGLQRGGRAAIVSVALLIASAPDAGAVVLGSSSWLGRHTVQIIGGRAQCTGVAISRTAVVTAAHCLGRGARVVAGGAQLAVAGRARSAAAENGVRVTVGGDAAILQLAQPLPFSTVPMAVGPGAGDFVIAGYGTTDESQAGAAGALHEARLVPAGGRALVDPNRRGVIGASACFGDSGGPVVRGRMLVGVITRASHPSPRIACGHLTHWAPVVAGGAPGGATTFAGGREVAGSRSKRRYGKRNRSKRWRRR